MEAILTGKNNKDELDVDLIPPLRFRSKEMKTVKMSAKQLQGEVQRLINVISQLKRELICKDLVIDQLREETFRDRLTNVYNRRGLDIHFQKAINLLPELSGGNRKSTSSSVSVLMIDIDWFKSVNDTYGHRFGDVVLKEIVKTIESSVRCYDTLGYSVGRFGGEEFVVLLPNTDEREICIVAEKIRKGIESLVFTQHNEFKVTVSIGGAIQREQSDKNLFDRADRAMYKAKKDGRNTVIIDAT